MLAAPLASTADDNLLVRSNALSGDEAYLVVRYEYTPGFDDIEAVSTGGQAHYWIGDHVKLGFTSNSNEQDDGDSSLNAADLTLRLSAESWLKLQQAQTEGMIAMPLFSYDGGFEFNSYDPMSFVNADAEANRADISVASRDIIGFGNARLSLYTQDVGAGFSAPGTDSTDGHDKLRRHFQHADRGAFLVGAKFDNLTQDQGIETQAQEYNVGFGFPITGISGPGTGSTIASIGRSSFHSPSRRASERTRFCRSATTPRTPGVPMHSCRIRCP